MGNIFTKRSIAFLFSALCILAVLAGCGSQGTVKTADAAAAASADRAPAEFAAEEQAETESESNGGSLFGGLFADEASPSGSGDFSDFGTNPNNISQANGAMAFDNEYLYCIRNNTEIWKVSLDGSTCSLLAEGEIRNADSWWASTPNIRNLNVWGGAVYYSGTGGDIHRVDVNSGADTVVLELALTRDQFSFTNMLIYQGKILYSLRNRKEDTLTIGVFDPETSDNYNVYVSDNCLRPCYLTAADDTFYMFYMDNNHKAIWSTPLNDLRADSEMHMVGETFENSKASWLYMRPDGALKTTSVWSCAVNPMVFGEIDENTLAINWQPDICKNADVLESDDKLLAGTVNNEIRYFLGGDSLVCLKWNYKGDDVEIWYVPGMDFGKSEKLITVTAPDTKGSDGVYYPYCGEKAEDTVYFLYTDENGTLTLISVDQKGTLTQTPVQ